MRKEQTLTCKVGKCPSCKKERMLYNKCAKCGKYFCKSCGSYSLVKDETQNYKTPELAVFMCHRCQGLSHGYSQTRATIRKYI